MVACRQLGLGYANHGLQVSGKEKGTKAIASKRWCLGQKSVKMSPLAGRLDGGLTKASLYVPRRPGTGIRECNRGGDEWSALHRH